MAKNARALQYFSATLHYLLEDPDIEPDQKRDLGELKKEVKKGLWNTKSQSDFDDYVAEISTRSFVSVLRQDEDSGVVSEPVLKKARVEPDSQQDEGSGDMDFGTHA